MVVDIITKDGKSTKYAKVVSFARMRGDWNDKLYIQTRINGNPKEYFIPIDTVDRFYVKEARRRA